MMHDEEVSRGTDEEREKQWQASEIAKSERKEEEEEEDINIDCKKIVTSDW